MRTMQLWAIIMIRLTMFWDNVRRISEIIWWEPCRYVFLRKIILALEKILNWDFRF